MKPLLNACTHGSGQDLILLHGLFGSHDNLRTLGKALAKKYRVHLVDLRNHGNSFHVDEMNYHDMAEDISRYMHANNLTPVCILGHSMGGKVAMQSGLLSPEYVSSLIVLDVSPVDYRDYRKENRHGSIMQALKRLSEVTITSRSEANALLKSYVDNETVCAFLLKNLKRIENNRFELCLNINAIIKNYDNLLSAPQGNPYPHSVLFLRGEYSDYLQDSHKSKIASLFPKSQLITIKNCGHWIHAEQPQAVYDAIDSFLSEIYGKP